MSANKSGDKHHQLLCALLDPLFPAPLIHLQASSSLDNYKIPCDSCLLLNVSDAFDMSSIYDAIHHLMGIELLKVPTSFAQFHSALLNRMASSDLMMTVIFEEAEKMLDLDEEAFACFCRLNLTIPFIKIVIVSKLSWEWLASHSGGITPISLRLPRITVDGVGRGDQVTVLVEKMCKPMLRSPEDLQAITNKVKQRTTNLKEIVTTCGDLMNLADYTGNTIELPQHQAFLVIAAYIASFNPLSHDVKIFGSEGCRRKRRRRVLKESKLKSTADLNLKDSLPKPIDIQRLLAIYHFIVPDPVPSFTRITEMLNHLITRKYLIYANKNTKNKFKVNLTREQVELLTKNVNCKLSMYLKDQ